MSPAHQLDLFAATGIEAASAKSDWQPPPRLVLSELDDAALIATIPNIRLAECRDIAAEAVRRGLTSAVPAFEALCRRFKGFGLTHTVPEQVAAVQALAAMGGHEASAALVRILCDDVMQGPGLAEAVYAAAALGARLPAERGMALLRHAEPAAEAPLQAEARDLLAANRLYRESVEQFNDPTLTAALDHLERVLIEVSNEPGGLTQARLDELQKEMNTDGLLFEVRVLRSRVQSDVQESVEPKQASATKGVSI